MARLAISKDYFPAYAQLPRKAQRKADEFLRKFEHDSTAAAIHLEPIKRTVDAQLRSARIGDDYRIILRAPEHGDVFLVLWADQHDAAYRWAITKQTAVHPATGSLQIFDVTAAAQALTTEVEPEPAPARPPSPEPGAEDEEQPAELFGSHSDEQLFQAGVPRPLLPSVRALSTEDDLDRLLPHLPPETGELLTALAAGISLDDAIDEILGRVATPAAAPTPEPIDVDDVPAALARDTTQRQFRLLDGELDLDAALKHPLDVWRVFLHPRQRRIARARTKGPTRVLGGAGTGKTVVALHRAAFLVREVFTKPDDRILFTTFSVNLAHDLRAQLGKLLEPDELARVEVVNLDSWASQYLRGRGVSVRPAFDKEQTQHFESAYEVYGKDDVALDFYRMEWREVIQEQGLRTEDDYVRAVRKSRGIPLGRADRRRLWPVFAAYRENLEHAGLSEPLDILRRAREDLEASTAAPRYRSVVVDEAQDFAADGLRLLRAIAGPERADDLFLVGDAHQRIYGRPVALSKCGIQIRGRRSQTLRLNYRTTGSICRWSLAILKDEAVDDLDDGAADRRGYVSLREGPAPNVHGCASPTDEERSVVAMVKAYAEAGVPLEAICIVARTQWPLRDRFGPALERAGMTAVLLEQEEPRLPGVRLATMHRAKGLEFAVVLLVGISKHDVPYSTPELRSDDPVMSAQALLRERSLLYVAASRARDALHVFYSGTPSPFLAALPTRRVEGVDPALAPTLPARTRRISSTAIPMVPDDGPSATPAAAPAADARLAEALAQPLVEVDLPTRMRNWSNREGLKTLGDLVARSPATLMAERNLGRKTVREVRAIVEGATGCPWEDLIEGAIASPMSILAAGDAPVDGADGWEVYRKHLTDAQKAIALDQMSLPVRLRTFVVREGLQTLGELAKFTRARLMAAPNMGRGTVDDLPKVIDEHMEMLAAASSLARLGLLECFVSVVEALEPTLRSIVTRRSGLVGEPMTLKELGEGFGVSRERVRQLETKACEQLARQPWVVEARRRLEAALAVGAVPLEILAEDPWWTAAVENPPVVAFIVGHVLADDVHVIDLDEASWLSRQKASVISEALGALVAAAREVRLPASLSTFEDLAAERAKGLGPHVASYLLEELRGRLQIGEDGRDVLAFGDSRNAELIALLQAADEPMHVDEIQRAMGRRLGGIPEEVLYFRRGYLGLRKHFHDFDGWQARLVPTSVRLMEQLGPDRQWYAGELLDELREIYDIPEWLTAFGLASLLKASGAVRYLGRQRVALLEGGADENRVFLHDALEKVLQEAGEPLTKVELVETLGKRVGTSEFGLLTTFNRPQFIRVDADRIGLLARDVPGGASAIAEAGDHVEALLARRGRGLSDVHVQEEVVGLSPEHARPLCQEV
jgi:superfamily I DNA/RNA helicase